MKTKIKMKPLIAHIINVKLYNSSVRNLNEQREKKKEEIRR